MVKKKQLNGIYNRITLIGTDELTDRADSLRTQRVNMIAAAIGALSFVFGWIYFGFTHNPLFLIATNTEVVLFATVIFLNYRRRHLAACFLLQGTITGAILYYGLILGPVIEGFILAAFLIASCLFFLKSKKLQRYNLLISVAALCIIEINKFYVFVPPLQMPPGSVAFMHYSASVVVLILISVTILYYVRNNQQLVAELMAHQSHLESEVASRTQELREANVSMDVFMRELTHELRTPLNAIFGIAQLKQHTSNDPLDKDLLAASFNILSVVNNMQDKYKLENAAMAPVTPESVELREWIVSIISLLRYYAATCDVKLSLSVDEKLPAHLYEDKALITQIAFNLIGNAIKFTGKGTTVTVSLALEGAAWSMSVKDEGPGIPPDRLQHLFKEFNRSATSLTEGTGIGLFIAKKFVQRLNGEIGVETVEGAGTCFTVTLPLLPVGDIVPPVPDNEVSLRFDGARALIVDDDIMTTKILTLWLTRLGFSVAATGDGKEGLETSKSERPDIILSDWGLPTLTGRDLVTRLKNGDMSDIPVIVMSDSFNQADACQAGADAFLNKPLDLHQLKKTLGNLLHYNPVN